MCRRDGEASVRCAGEMVRPVSGVQERWLGQCQGCRRDGEGRVRGAEDGGKLLTPLAWSPLQASVETLRVMMEEGREVPWELRATTKKLGKEEV